MTIKDAEREEAFENLEGGDLEFLYQIRFYNPLVFSPCFVKKGTVNPDLVLFLAPEQFNNPET